MNRAIFLDKDGTLIPDIPYNVNTDLITLQTETIEGLKSLHAAGFMLIVISNQSGVAKGHFAEGKLPPVVQKLTQLLAEQQLPLNGFYYCPHHPEGTVDGYDINCDCRKPEPGMLYKAAAELNIDLTKSWMIGDILNDAEAGNRAGCQTILIDNGNETEWLNGDFRTPTIICKNINEAAQKIITYSSYEQMEQL